MLMEFLRRGRSFIASRPMLSTVVAVCLVNTLAKGVGAMKDIVVASRFGTSASLDAFFVALMVVIFFTNTVAASYGEAFLPVFVRVRERDGADAASEVLRRATLHCLLITAVTALLIELFAPMLLDRIASHFSPETLGLCRRLVRVMLPAVVISGVTTVWSAALNASGEQNLVATLPMVAPSITILLLLMLPATAGSLVLALGISIGAVVEMVLLACRLRRIGYPITVRVAMLDDTLRMVLWQSGPLVAASFLATSSPLVDQAMAATLRVGSVSALNYGGKGVALISGAASVALSAAIFPRFAQLVAGGDWSGLDRIVRQVLRNAMLAASAVSVILIIASTPIVRVLFQRGSFTSSDTETVSLVQRCFLLQLPFSISGMVGVRLLNAMGMNRVLAILGLITVLINVGLNYVLMRFIGVAGIAMSTSIVISFSFSVVIWATRRELLGRMRKERSAADSYSERT